MMRRWGRAGRIWIVAKRGRHGGFNFDEILAPARDLLPVDPDGRLVIEDFGIVTGPLVEEELGRLISVGDAWVIQRVPDAATHEILLRRTGRNPISLRAAVTERYPPSPGEKT
jgi:hypothetical protein